MIQSQRKRVAVIGGGISGIAAAKVLKQQGVSAVIFEKDAALGGVWADAYPDVRLQNIASQYHLSDFPWPTKPDLHPSAAQVREYLRQAVAHFALDVRLQHTVIHLTEQTDGWLVRHESPAGVHEERFDYVIVAVGQYSDRTHRPRFPGQEHFRGTLITDSDVRSLDVFDGQRTVVVGFGKTALDMATLAAGRSARVHHVFRTPRWLLPEHILGVHFTFALFNRLGTVMMPSWSHPTAIERFLHRRLGSVVSSFWKMVESIFRLQMMRHAVKGDSVAEKRLLTVLPQHQLVPDLRSATALAPERYYRYVADGQITPHHGAVRGFTRTSVELSNGDSIACDLVMMCVGSERPTFPFLPSQYRQLLEEEVGGPQLFRHLVHPRIPRLGFVGFNHGFMHVPIVEVGTLWLAALFRDELALPTVAEMDESIHHIRAWKRQHIHFEPASGSATSTRYQQYLDTLLKDLGISPYRKLPNVVAEVFARYEARDYRDASREYDRKRERRTRILRPIRVHM